jgi:Tol biopolymer transport system component
MSLAPGMRVGIYEVLAKIGEGGMGEVYRAVDTELHRVVALKVLPEHFVTNPDRVARFEREATTLAAINDPHVAQIYGIARSGDDRRVLVMEFVEGIDLAARIRQGRLPLEEALAIGRQVAAALAIAHDSGVIHRDLKPANIKLRWDGVVKVLDFGLARNTVTPSSTDQLSDSPTLSPVMTGSGIILGTAAYMSPEQAKGSHVDRRSDMWSFGCVLFEMLTGRRAFTGSTAIETAAAVLTKTPDWSLLPVDTPEPIRKLLRQCLNRERSQRLDSATVARIEIEDALSGAPAAAAAAGVPPARSIRWLLIGAAVAALAVAGLVAWLQRPPTLPGELRLDIATPATADAYSFALSPDGKRIAFVAAGATGPLQLWTRAFDSATAVALPNTDGAVYPFWSPDSLSLGFFAGGKLKRIDLAGASPIVLADAGAGRGGAWSVDGQILFNQSASGPISIVSATGSPVRTVTSLEPGEGGHLSPAWHPDGRRFLFHLQSGDPDKRGTYLASLDQPARARLLATDGSAEFRGADEVFFVREDTLYIQAFDEAKNAVIGAPTPVTSPVATSFARSAFSVSRGGPVAYRAGRVLGAQLRWFGRKGESLEAFARPDTEGQSGAMLSPSGRRVAITRRVGCYPDIWIVNREGGAAARVTTDPAQEVFPVWTPDERAIVFRSSRSKTLDIYLTRVDAIGNESLLLNATALGVSQISPTDISRDGRWLLFYSTPQNGSRDVWVHALGQTETAPRRLIATPADESNARFSPDGKWIAYQTNESGRFEIAVRAFPAGDRMWQVSSGGGVHARWSRDGTELFYIAPDANLMAVKVDTAGSIFQTSAAVPLFAPRLAESAAINPFNAQYDVGPDGRFLINVPVDDLASSPITLILNWARKQ